jgi:hypothetical protein
MVGTCPVGQYDTDVSGGVRDACWVASFWAIT